MTEIEDIVRALAAHEPNVSIGLHIHCVFCNDNSPGHEPGCPWRRAREWIDANPAPEAAEHHAQ